MEEGLNAAVEANRNQFFSTYHMLQKLVKICPEQVWRQMFYGYAFWYHVYHCVYYMDYWFREEYASEFVPLIAFEEEIPPDMEKGLEAGLVITKEGMQNYLDLIEEKVLRFFDGLTDQDLGKPIMPGAEQFTYMDIIIGQNRHVMYNMGYLNGILRSLGLEESEWWAYNEKEE